jgi:uncharacterized membrane protein (DUF106 family)
MSIQKFQELIQNALKELNDERKALEKEKDEFLAMQFKLESVQLPSTVTLNVGGIHYTTSLQTLQLSGNRSFFEIMFSGNWEPKPDKDGSYFIDR